MSANVITPLEGEPTIPGVATPKVSAFNTKQFVAIAVLVVSIVAVLGFSISRYFSKPADIPEKAASTPEVASAQAPPLKLLAPASTPAASQPASQASAASGGTKVPSIEPIEGDAAEAIKLHGTGATSASTASANTRKVMSPDDAPMFSAGGAPAMHSAPMPAGPDARSDTTSSQAGRDSGNAVSDARASLDGYKRQLNGMLDNLQTMTTAKAQSARSIASQVPSAPGTQAAPASLFGSMERSATPRVQARMLGDRSMVVAKGTLLLCSLKTRVVSATSGFIGCQTTRNVLSDNGRVLLVERGSHLDGEYRIVTVRPGVTRIPVLWTRLRTPQGVTVDLDSPATGELGESGLSGYVDNRWGERLGAALMLSLIDDAIKYATASHDESNGSNTVVLPNTTAQGSKLAEKVLETTINIPPLLYQNQGGVVGVYVTRDIDFSSVYELRPQ